MDRPSLSMSFRSGQLPSNLFFNLFPVKILLKKVFTKGYNQLIVVVVTQEGGGGGGGLCNTQGHTYNLRI